MTKPAAKPAVKRSTASARPAKKASRSEKGEARRDEILAAALDEFSAKGFEAARLDDVAKRAGIAKGTIYLYFRDKETLFHELLREHLSPLLNALEASAGQPLPDGVPVRTLASTLLGLFVREVLQTRRKEIIRLILTEGPRFPKLAEMYYRDVVSRGVGAIRVVMKRAVEKGELPNDALVRFPQLLVAPGLAAIFWKAMFDKFEPLDVDKMMQAHIDLIFGTRGAS